jgi:hypothetical protein
VIMSNGLFVRGVVVYVQQVGWRSSHVVTLRSRVFRFRGDLF